MHHVTNTGVVCTTQVVQKLITGVVVLKSCGPCDMRCILMSQSNMVQTVTQVIKIGDFKTFTDLQK